MLLSDLLPAQRAVLEDQHSSVPRWVSKIQKHGHCTGRSLVSQQMVLTRLDSTSKDIKPATMYHFDRSPFQKSSFASPNEAETPRKQTCPVVPGPHSPTFFILFRTDSNATIDRFFQASHVRGWIHRVPQHHAILPRRSLRHHRKPGSAAYAAE